MAQEFVKPESFLESLKTLSDNQVANSFFTPNPDITYQIAGDAKDDKDRVYLILTDENGNEYHVYPTSFSPLAYLKEENRFVTVQTAAEALLVLESAKKIKFVPAFGSAEESKYFALGREVAKDEQYVESDTYLTSKNVRRKLRPSKFYKVKKA